MSQYDNIIKFSVYMINNKKNNNTIVFLEFTTPYLSMDIFSINIESKKNLNEWTYRFFKD